MKILLVQTGFLGDLILSTPVLQNLKEWFPEATITVLTTPLAAPLVQYHPQVASCLVYDKRGKDSGLRGLFKVAKQLREMRFDIAISLHKSYRTALLLRFSGTPRRIGYAEARLPFLYTDLAKRTGPAHEVQRNLTILSAVAPYAPQANLADLKEPMHIEIPSDAREEATRLLAPCADRLPIGIAPGSVWATKRWTVEGYAETAKGLYEQGFAVVILGGKDDSAIAERIVELSGVPCNNLVGVCSLITSAAVISRLRLLITNDSSPLHMASACGTPLVAIFCATVPEFGYGPWHVPAEVVGVTGLHCRPCGRHGGQTCPTGTHACQKELSARDVLAATRRVIDATASGRSKPLATVISGTSQ